MKDLKSGDWVKVLRKPTDEELLTWNNSWISDSDSIENMDSALGKTLEVKFIPEGSKEEAVLIDGVGDYYYPIFILEKTEAPQES